MNYAAHRQFFCKLWCTEQIYVILIKVLMVNKIVSLGLT